MGGVCIITSKAINVHIQYFSNGLIQREQSGVVHLIVIIIILESERVASCHFHT